MFYFVFFSDILIKTFEYKQLKEMYTYFSVSNEYISFFVYSYIYIYIYIYACVRVCVREREREKRERECVYVCECPYPHDLCVPEGDMCVNVFVGV